MVDNIERLTGNVVAVQCSRDGEPSALVLSGARYIAQSRSRTTLPSNGGGIGSAPASRSPLVSGEVSNVSNNESTTSFFAVPDSGSSGHVTPLIDNDSSDVTSRTVSNTTSGDVRFTPDTNINITSESASFITGLNEDGASGGIVNSAVERKNANIESVTFTASNQTRIENERPKNIQMASKIRRLKSFTRMAEITQTKEKLSLAGFYYAGYGDCVRCFSCGGGLHDWKSQDDVWVEHAKWFPNCKYVYEQQGQLFIDVVQKLKTSNDEVSVLDVTSNLQAHAEQRRCKRCNRNEAKVVLFPCGHVSCYYCAHIDLRRPCHVCAASIAKRISLIM